MNYFLSVVDTLIFHFSLQGDGEIVRSFCISKLECFIAQSGVNAVKGNTNNSDNVQIGIGQFLFETKIVILFIN